MSPIAVRPLLEPHLRAIGTYFIVTRAVRCVELRPILRAQFHFGADLLCSDAIAEQRKLAGARGRACLVFLSRANAQKTMGVGGGKQGKRSRAAAGGVGG